MKQDNEMQSGEEPQVKKYVPVLLDPEILEDRERLNQIEQEEPMRIVSHNMAILAISVSKMADTVMGMTEVMRQVMMLRGQQQIIRPR